jgi:hypothetical protein
MREVFARLSGLSAGRAAWTAASEFNGRSDLTAFRAFGLALFDLFIDQLESFESRSTQ